MKKSISLTTKTGLVYTISLEVSLVTGAVTLDSFTKSAQLFGEFKPCTEKTLSVKAENGHKKYLISLVPDEAGEFEVVLDDITGETVKPLWQQIAGKTKLSLAVYDELQAIHTEFEAIYSTLSDNTQVEAVTNSRQNSLLRAASKLSDAILKQNSKHGASYSVFDFINACIQ